MIHEELIMNQITLYNLTKGVKMKTKDKMPYIYNHIELIEEALQTIKDNIRWISSDVKFIKKLSKEEKLKS